MAKKKISGRIIYGVSPNGNHIYWTCPTRKCKEIHYFTFIPQVSSGAKPIYEKKCDICDHTYVAMQILVSYTTAMLVATFKDEGDLNGN